MATEIKTTVMCPLCGQGIPGVVDDLTRTDVLMGHLVKEHGSRARPNLPHEGPPLPHGLGVKWPWKHSNPSMVGPIAAVTTALKLGEKPKEKPKDAGKWHW